MGKFGKERGGKSFGGKSFGGKSFGGDRGGRPSFGGRREERSTESFKAVCDSCHKSCELPFRPTTGKPVYCNDCFAKNRDFDNRPSFSGRDGDRGGDRRNDRNSFSKRNDRGDRRDEKPSFSTSSKNGDSDMLKKQVDALHVKLDTMMREFADLKNAVRNVAVASAPIVMKEVKKDAEKIQKVVAKKTAVAKKVIAKDIKVVKKAVSKAVTKVAKKVAKKTK